MVNDSLLKQYKLNNDLTLKNRIVMAPMTRAKASHDLIPNMAAADYYGQRAAAGLIVTEGAVISSDALGHPNVPGIFNQEQVNQWKNIANRVHENNGLIFMQIWHVGRVSHPSLLGGRLPIAPSETMMTGAMNRNPGLYFGKSRAASLSEIQMIIDHFASAAENAMKAGFDGIEIHGANGYLVDQFLHFSTNQRKDEYGGTPENMARFALELVHACGNAIGYERVGLRLSPGAYLNQIIGEESDALVFQYLLEKLNELSIAYVHTGNFNDQVKFNELKNLTMTEFMRQYYKGTLIACGAYSFETAREGLESNLFDLVAFGKPFIANPNLIECLRESRSLNSYDVSMLETLY